MDSYQGRIWYERALFYGQNGDEKNAKKAYAIAMRYDPTLPPLPKFRNHNLLKGLEQASLIAALCIVGWLIYLLLLHPLSVAKEDFPTRMWVFGGKSVEETDSWIKSAEFAEQTSSGTYEGDTTLLKENNLTTDTPRTDTGQNFPKNPKSNDSGNQAANSDDFNKPPVGSDNDKQKPDPVTTTDGGSRLPYILLRNALYYYTADHGQFPDKLDVLIETTYLDRIPAEPVSSSNKVYPHFTDQGGWVYAPPTVLAPQHLAEQVEVSVYANQRGLSAYPFVPLHLEINTSEPTVTLLSGNNPLKSWPAAVGTSSTPTPNGSFRIIEKHVLAQDPANPYGSRWMQLGTEPPDHSGTDPLAARGIGIHGTQSPTDVGSSVTNGCIRMRNSDIEELFQLIPNGMRVDVVTQ